MKSGLLHRAPLRVKLVAAVLLLVTAALAGAGAIATTALRHYLVSRNDQQIAAVIDEVVRCPLPTATSGSGRACGRDDRMRGGPRGGQGDDDRGLGPPSPFVVQFSKPDGTVVAELNNPLRSDEAQPLLPAMTLADAKTRSSGGFTVASKTGDDQWRVVSAPLSDGSGSVMVAQGLGDVSTTVRQLMLLELVIGGIVLVCVAVVGYLLVRRSLRPLEDVEQTAEAIAAGDLTRRVSTDAHPATEVGRLSASLNGMLHQIETAFAERATSEASARNSEERMRRFVADASHELRTPLTSIAGFADLVRRGAVRDAPELRSVVARIEGEAGRMRALVEDLLLLARMDEQRPLDLVAVPLVDVAADVVLDAQALEPNRSIDLVLDDEGSPVVYGDVNRLRQVVSNLVRNALVHTPPEACVTVRIARRDGELGPEAVIEVIDDGPGLSPEDAERVFSRFYRVDAARSRDDGGSGLGLSIVRALVTAHHGLAELDTALGRGATFRVVLPLADVQVAVDS